MTDAPVTTAPPALNGTTKAAVLLISLGTEVASKVLACLGDAEVEKLSIEIAHTRRVPSETVETVLMEYRDLGMTREHVAQGGPAFARATLQDALGESRAEEVMMKVEAAMDVSAFHLLQAVETEQIVAFLEGEHPQTSALILAHLNPRKAGAILSEMPSAIQADIIGRLATLGKTAPHVLHDVEDVIRQQIGSLVGAAKTAGGVEAVAQVLNNTSRSAEKEIMEGLRQRNADLAAAIKGHMFVFDDLVQIADRDMQRLLMEVDQKDLALALKAVSDELQAKILGNVSERAAQTIQEEVELMGPARVTDVEEAQRRILEAAQDLEEREEISLSRSAGSEQML
ncbi:MAG: flagellar motor switch protein FliG [Rhodothermales bacterium]|nr:flagellar motor switch protein FliG [Rhodothermales bacterium]